MMALYAALVKGFFAEEGLRVQAMEVDPRTAIEQGKPYHFLYVQTDQGLTEADFGFLILDQLHHLAAGKVDYYIVDGMHFGCEEVLVPPDSPMKSPADLKGKTIAIHPLWVSPFTSPNGLWFIHQELRTAGLDPATDVTLTTIPWDALPNLTDYVAEGFKTGKFAAVAGAQPAPLLLREQQLARPLFTQTSQARYTQEYCCVFGIKRAIVDGQPDKAARIVRAFRRAKQWVAQNPVKAVIAAQAAGYYGAAIPVEPSANEVVSFGFDREVDLAQMLERAFKERIEAGVIKTDRTPQELVRLVYRRLE
jgi:NitT/TauT family transport system substrate-binding protein